ncbi:UNVERIFIED_ASMBLY: hypothetical protein SD1_67 [Shigella phage 2019SD1]|uniref:Uncharacterized protein n=1 Tax=Shigella phage 2019SD1 TaxID=2848074 RepID=A0A6M5CAX5_9CAUD|nr:hypothetical protein H1N84_gp66 [Shigella phage 2019SD1]
MGSRMKRVIITFIALIAGSHLAYGYSGIVESVGGMIIFWLAHITATAMDLKWQALHPDREEIMFNRAASVALKGGNKWLKAIVRC